MRPGVPPCSVLGKFEGLRGTFLRQTFWNSPKTPRVQVHVTICGVRDGVQFLMKHSECFGSRDGTHHIIVKLW